MQHHDITVVITTFRSDTKIISCLDSINSKYKVLIVENSNNTDFKNKVEKRFSNVECILAGENLGYAKGNNLGLSKVKTKYSLILNPDAILDSQAINNFFETVKKNENFAIIGPYIQEENKDHPKKNDNILQEVDNVKGFAMFLNIPEFKDVGFFDSNFFIYFEEIDLCRRVKLRQKKIYIDPSIRIFHPGGSSHDEEINEVMEFSRNWHWMWSTFYYNKKYNGYIFALITIMPKLFSSFVKTIFYAVCMNKFKSKIYFQRMSGIVNSIIGKKSWYRPKVL